MRSNFGLDIAIVGYCLFFFSIANAATPLVAPGDYRFRHDVLLLKDARVLQGPLSTWPLSLSQVYDGLAAFDERDDQQLAAHVNAALSRVRSRLERSRGEGWNVEVSSRGGSEPKLLRSFADTPRGKAEFGLATTWTGGHFAGELRAAGVVDDPADDQELRLDGTWIGATTGNWLFAAGLMERYWGPAWQSGLIVSNNARPRPGLTVRRTRSTPFETPWLSWLGPWHFTFFLEQLESDRPVEEPFFTGARFSFQPFESLELGLSRSSQFGGRGRDVGLDTVANVITGQTTETNALVGSASGINQLAGGDARWNLPWLPVALYGELIGEDEQGLGPVEYLGQGGIEIWGGFGESGHSWRFIAEYADTSAGILEKGDGDSDNFGVAYNNGSFPAGYRYRGRVLGHSAESDALLASTRLIVSLADGLFINLAGMSGELNRLAVRNTPDRDPTSPLGRVAANTLTQINEDVTQVDLSIRKQFWFARLEIGVGHTERKARRFDQDSSNTFGWVGFDRQF